MSDDCNAAYSVMLSAEDGCRAVRLKGELLVLTVTTLAEARCH